MRTREGLDEVFRPAGFGPADWETVRIDLTGPPEQVWRAVGGLYDLGLLDAAVSAGLRARFEAETAASALPDGRIPCAMRVHVARRCGAVLRGAGSAGTAGGGGGASRERRPSGLGRRPPRARRPARRRSRQCGRADGPGRAP